MNLQTLLGGQENLAVLIAAFIIGGIFKKTGLFLPVFDFIVRNVKSKRLGLAMISALAGVLPIEGRVSISAPVLDSIAGKREGCDCGDCKQVDPREKLGILDYLATHHYYLWSPLEKSIVLIMAGLSLSYWEVIHYTAIPLIVYVAFMAFVIMKYIDEDDIITVIPKEKISLREALSTTADMICFLAAIVLSIFWPPYFVFPIFAAYLMIKHRHGIVTSIKHVNWKVVLVVAGVIILANFIKENSSALLKLLSVNGVDLNGWQIAAAIIGGGVASFCMGSSGKYAGVTVVLTLLLGMKWFPVIFMVEYIGYLLSPTHKCLAIAVGYFKTRISEFYYYFGILSALLLCAGLVEMR